MIWFCLCLNFFVFAPPSLLNINQRPSLENYTVITSHLSNTNSEFQRKTNTNRTRMNINQHQFNISAYRSSWKFVDKNTIRVRFRLDESLLQSIISTRFLVRHLHSNHIRTYDEPHEIINSTLTLYLHNMKHGRHIVCLVLYRSKLMLNPRHVFCQDIVYNFQKYGHHDMDVDEHGNTFVFLLTQYSIVLGILCILQIVYTARKRRFLRAVCDKANALRHVMTEHYHHSQENKLTITDINPQTHALACLIYNLNRNALYNTDQLYTQPTNDEEDLLGNSNRQRKDYEQYLKIPNQFRKNSMPPLFEHPRLLATTEFDEDIFDESDFDTRSYEEQSISYRSVSHILEENKPWMVKLTDNGTIQHAIVSSEEGAQQL